MIMAALVYPAFYVWTRQFSRTGAMMALLQQMCDRGFQWESLRFSALLAWCAPVIIAFSKGVYGSLQMMSVLHDSNNTAVRIMFFLGIPMNFIFTSVGIGIHALVFLASKLHEHDLMCYAGAMVKAMPSADSSLVTRSLKKLEFTVSARLRYASTTWVRFTVLEIILSGMWALAACARLLMAHEQVSTRSTYGWIMILVVASSFVLVLSAPLAAVAETFEYDVLKSLNNPSVLKHAQQHFGQQLLAHLRTLDWGFRVGGTVISNRMVVNVATVLVITSVTAVSQSFIAISR
jgi:hypothetical protein